MFVHLSVCLFVCLFVHVIIKLRSFMITQDGAPLTSLIKIGPNIDVQLAPENAEVCYVHPCLVCNRLCHSCAIGISTAFISRSERDLI